MAVAGRSDDSGTVDERVVVVVVSVRPFTAPEAEVRPLRVVIVAEAEPEFVVVNSLKEIRPSWSTSRALTWPSHGVLPGRPESEPAGVSAAPVELLRELAGPFAAAAESEGRTLVTAGSVTEPRFEPVLVPVDVGSVTAPMFAPVLALPLAVAFVPEPDDVEDEFGWTVPDALAEEPDEAPEDEPEPEPEPELWADNEPASSARLPLNRKVRILWEDFMGVGFGSFRDAGFISAHSVTAGEVCDTG